MIYDILQFVFTIFGSMYACCTVPVPAPNGVWTGECCGRPILVAFTSRNAATVIHRSEAYMNVRIYPVDEEEPFGYRQMEFHQTNDRSAWFRYEMHNPVYLTKN